MGSGSDGWLHRDIISKALPKFIAVKLIQSHEKQKCASGFNENAVNHTLQRSQSADLD